MTSNTAVYGLYKDRGGVEDAITSLRNSGFRSTDVSVLFPENVGSRDFAHEKHTKAPEGGMAGGASGALLGGALGWLAGIGMLAIPGLGPFVVAGPLMSVLAGAGAGGTVGAIVGSLVGMGMPEYEARRYEGRIREGGILFSVHCDTPEWVKRAEELLKQTGAEDVASAAEASAAFHVTNHPAHPNA